MLVALNKHQVEAFLGEVVSVDATSFGTSAIDDSTVSVAAALSSRLDIFAAIADRLKVSHDSPAEASECATCKVHRCTESNVENGAEEETGVVEG